MATTAGPEVRTASLGASRTRRVVSRVLAAATAVVAVTTLALAFVAAGDAWRGAMSDVGVLIAAVIGTAGMGIVGAILTARAPASPLGPLYQVGALSMMLAVGCSLYGARALMELHRLPGVPIAGWLMQASFPIAFAATFSAFLLFPDGRPPSPRWGFVWWLLWGGAALAFVGTTFGARTFDFDPGTVANPFAMGPEGLFTAFNVVGGAAEFLGGILAVVSVVVRFGRSDGEERQQLRWLARAAGLIIACVVALTVVGVTFPGGTAFDLAFLALLASVLIGLPVATAIAVLRYRLYELDLVVKKTAIYSIVALALTGLYLLLLGGAALAGLGPDPGRRGVRADVQRRADAGSAARRPDRLRDAGDALRGPLGVLRARRRDVLDRRRAAPDDATARRGDRRAGGQDVDPSGAGPAIRRGRARGGGGTPDVALLSDELPPFGEGVHAFPVMHQGELLGAITLSMAANDPMDATKERLAHGVASQAGLALRNVRLVEDLRASRRRIVAAQDERAKALERNIHDGAQQQLVALTVRLRIAEQLAERDPSSVAATLRELQGQASTALEDLRDLARGIYPPLLADKGSNAALESQARKAVLPVALEGDDVGRYAQEVESTVYFCVLEALNNVAKYADASAATAVSLSRTDGVLTFEVRDDGRGFDAEATTYGTGLQGMADRLDAVGGRLTLRSDPAAAPRCAESPVPSHPAHR